MADTIKMLRGKPIFSDDFPNDEMRGIFIMFDKPRPIRDICKQYLTDDEFILVSEGSFDEVVKVLKGEEDANTGS